MKKILLLFSIISLVFCMSSCLKSGSSVFTENALAYISDDQGSGGRRALTIYGRPLTFTGIESLQLGKFYGLAYSGDENDRTTSNLYKVTVSKKSDPIATAMFVNSQAPESETKEAFESINVFHHLPVSKYYGNYIILPYKWRKKEGESAKITVYSSLEGESVRSTSKDSDPLLLDVRLERIGTPSANATEKMQEGLVVVKINNLKNVYLIPSGSDYRDISVKLRYYKKKASNDVELTESSVSKLRLVKN